MNVLHLLGSQIDMVGCITHLYFISTAMETQFNFKFHIATENASLEMANALIVAIPAETRARFW